MAGLKQLDPDTISKIAAGEVVQRPSSALKELLENSIDALSTSVHVKIKEGGLKFMQLHDNGTGIHVEDYPILCKRFTTSKISHYSDLQKLTTFGFRGEALSSISQVSKLTVISRKEGESIGYKASFSGGEMVEEAHPYALDRGTILQIEDMFSNMPGRLRALSSSEEHRRCLEVVAKYSIHFPGVMMKVGAKNVEFFSSGKADRLEVIRLFLKNMKVQEELIELEEHVSEFVNFSGVVSSPFYSHKTSHLILFINNRLVEAPELTKLVSNLYSAYLPKNSCYFVYLSLNLPPVHIDVNVHPTKSQVKFIHQSKIFCEIQTVIQEALQNSNSKRSYNVKVISHSTQYKPKDIKSQVRESPRDTKLEWYLAPVEQTQPKQMQEDLSSIQELKQEITFGSEQTILQNSVLIGCIDKERILIQHETSSYIVLVPLVFQEMNYQYILELFGELPYSEIPNSNLRIEELLEMSLELDHVERNTSIPKDKLIAKLTELLTNKAELLDDYFSVTIEEGILKKVPILANGYVSPDIKNLPEFLLKLALQVNWRNEKQCLEAVSRHLAWFYSFVPDSWEIAGQEYSFDYIYKNMTFPYLSQRIKADSRTLVEGKALFHVVSTETLYKIFERC
mgnify:FL=1